MKIVIAPDSFKDCLDAATVARCLATGIRRAMPDAELTGIPLADGGEGFVRTLLSALGGEHVTAPVLDPLMRPIDAGYGILPDGSAVIEMAAASGIERLSAGERNPLLASTYGTGQLMLHAMERGCRTLLIGIGGSATNDGGTGMATALGYRFCDRNGNELAPGGGSLEQLSRIDFSAVTPLLGETAVWVACDVSNPLCGPNGASAVYGPQKGASAAMVEQLDANLGRLAAVVKKYLNADVLAVPGGGAAGGLGAGLLAFCGGRIRRGFDLVSEQTGLDEAVRRADWVVTGEGKIDGQTRHGKTPWGVAQLARKHGKPVVAFAGTLGEGCHELLAEGFTAMFALPNGPATLAECVAQAPALLADSAEQVFRVVACAQKTAAGK